MMENQSQQTQPVNSSSPQDVFSFLGGENRNVPKLPAADKSVSQWQEILNQIMEFLGKLPDYLGAIFNNNKRALINLILILSAFVTVKVVIALLDAVNDIPLLQPIFELIGLFYSVWFAFRYLLKFDTRQELSQKFNAFKQRSFG
ncbi:CAAD domain-containing protein [Dolichospermum circinale]|uniref:CAAD domain-containing protein n=1 Tax=Dolichospermum circinale TaxID=109265 RepID=UPI002FEE61F5